MALPVKALKVGQESYWLDQIAKDRNERAAEQGVEQLDALAGDVRSVQAACRPGASGRVKVETVERACRKVLRIDPRTLYGEHFDQAWAHRGKRVDARVASFDHCFSFPKSVSLLAGGGGEQVRSEVAAGQVRPEVVRAVLDATPPPGTTRPRWSRTWLARAPGCRW